MTKHTKPLLVVDGYNVLFANPTYQDKFDEPEPPSRLGNDPFMRAREAMLADVAAYAGSEYEAVIVFDGANNLSAERPTSKRAGVRIYYSRTGYSADYVIEQLVTQARDAGRRVHVITSDQTIRATVAGEGVTFASSALIAREFATMNADIAREHQERSYSRMTVEDRIDPGTLAKLNRMLGRQ